jgi:hypothetical protein
MIGEHASRWLWPLACLVIVVSGCDRGGVGATARGLVKIDGQAAPAGIRVDFQPQGPNGSTSTGITDAKGEYELFFTAARKGVMPGECVVRVTVMQQLSAEGIPKVPESLKDLKIPEHYGRQSTITRMLKPGHNQIDIEIDTTSAPPKSK